MTELGAVVGSLGSMSQLQLLLAFITCSAYAFAIGDLLPGRGRHWAWGMAGLGALGFTFEGDDWTHAAMLVGFAVAGLAAFVALVWVTSRVIKVDAPTLAESESGFATDTAWRDSASTPLADLPRARPQPTGPAHFV